MEDSTHAVQTQPQGASAPARPASAVTLGLILVFFLSGASALIDQIVWARSLHRIFGVTSLATATVLAAFMAGLSLGSYTLGKWIDRWGSPLRVYAIMEVLIAVLAPLTLLLFRWIEPLYVVIAQSIGFGSPLLPWVRLLLSFLLLLPPTFLMGGTLPVLAKGFFRQRPAYVAATLYSVNTWGAVSGCFAAGFVLLAFFGETRSLLFASCGNLIAALWAFSQAKKPQQDAEVEQVAEDHPATSTPKWLVTLVLAVAFSNGLAALALEVLWARVLSIYTDASVYSITTIIGVVLIGIALGSKLAQKPAERSKNPLRILGWLSLLMGLSVGVAIYLFYRLTPLDAVGGLWFFFMQNVAAMPLLMLRLAWIAILPVTLLSGACFPFLVRLAVRNPAHHGREMGKIYAVNTIGGIIGSILAGFVLLPHIGDAAGFFLIAAGYALMGGLCIILSGRRAQPIIGATALAAVLAVLAIVLPIRHSLTYDALLRAATGEYKILEHRDTAEGSVTAVRQGPEMKLLVNGVCMTVLCGDTKMLAHLPLALHPDPKNILVICFGMGTTFRSAWVDQVPVDAVELQPAVLDFYPYFHANAEETVRDPKRARRIAGDGRNYLLLNEQKYSVITIDPAPPLHSAGAVNLYTREFYELCRSRLDENGIMCMWVPFDGLEEDQQMIERTFIESFEHVKLAQGPNRLGVILLGSEKPIVEIPERIKTIFESPGFAKDMEETNPGYAASLEGKAPHLIDEETLKRLIGDGKILTDDRPYTEFPWFRWLRHGGKR